MGGLGVAEDLGEARGGLVGATGPGQQRGQVRAGGEGLGVVAARPASTRVRPSVARASPASRSPVASISAPIARSMRAELLGVVGRVVEGVGAGSVAGVRGPRGGGPPGRSGRRRPGGADAYSRLRDRGGDQDRAGLLELLEGGHGAPRRCGASLARVSDRWRRPGVALQGAADRQRLAEAASPGEAFLFLLHDRQAEQGLADPRRDRRRWRRWVTVRAAAGLMSLLLVQEHRVEGEVCSVDGGPGRARPS